MIMSASRRARRNRIIGGSIAAAGAIVTALVFALSSSTSASGGYDGPTGVYQMTDADITALREATAPYADSAAATAAGRVNLDLCIDMMGEHYADPATFSDGVLDATDPEAMVYADVDGTEKLVAVEWVSTQPGQVLGIPLHLNHDLDVWVLHAWIGLDNPAGMLADHNTNVGACPAA